MIKKFLFLLLPVLSSCLKNASHLISYEADGTSNSYEISYKDASGDSIHLNAVTNLWREEFVTDRSGKAILWMRNRNKTGTAIGSIYCDGKLAGKDSVGASDSLKIEVKY